MARREGEPGEGRRSEEEGLGAIWRIEAPELVVRPGELSEGGRFLAECRDLSVIEEERGQPLLFGELADEGSEGGVSHVDEDDGGAGRENRADERESELGAGVPGMEAEPADRPGIEGAVLDVAPSVPKDEHTRVPADRETFEHRRRGQVVSCFVRVRTTPMK